jgi:hypothetical protein
VLLIPSPTQAEALRQWVLDAVNRGDDWEALEPAPFTDAAVYWGGRDHPSASRYVQLAGISLTGPPLTLEYASADVGEDTQTLVETRARWREWSVVVTVAAKPDRTASAATQLADAASVHLGRIMGAWDGVAIAPLRAVGLAPRRLGDVVDDARLRGSSEWETRASVVLVLGAGWYAQRSVDWVARATGDGDVGGQSLALDTDLEA